MSTVADLHPNDLAEQLTGRPYLSYSAMTTYTSCPLKYHFKYVAGLPEETVSASLVFGGAIHRSLELHFRELLAGNGPPSLESLFAAYHDAWDQHQSEEVQFNKTDDRASLDELAARMLAAFQESDLSRPAGVLLGMEEELSGELVPGCPDLLARLDLLVDTGDAVVLTDFKTARSRWSNEQVLDSAGQLLLYHELVKPLADGRPVRLEFAVITKTKNPEVIRHPVHVDQHQIDRTKMIFERVWDAIQSGYFYPSPSPMQCPTCPFRVPCRAWTG